MMYALGLHLLEATVIAALIAVAVSVLPIRRAATRHALLLLAALKFAVPSAALFLLGARLQPIVPVPVNLVVPVPAVALTRAAIAPAPPERSISFAIGLFWLAGSFILAARWIASYRRKRCCVEGPREYQEILDRLCRDLGIGRAVRLCASDRVADPVVCGILRPIIVVPKDLEDRLMEQEFEAVLHHELAHVRRWDNLTGSAVHMLACVFWPHPLVWWLERRMLRERERACDEFVLCNGVSHSDYAAAILKVCSLPITDAVAGTAAASGSDLVHRMEVIMSSHSFPHPSRFSRIGIACLAMSFAAVPAGLGLLHAQQGSSQASSASCLYDGQSFPEGTVVSMGKGNKACTAGSWKPSTLPTNATLPEQKPVANEVCTPAPAREGELCECQNGRYSLGAIVRSDTGKLLRCDRYVLGKSSVWREATPAELGRK